MTGSVIIILMMMIETLYLSNNKTSTVTLNLLEKNHFNIDWQWERH